MHLVNLTNPMMMKGPCRELIPNPPQEAHIHLGALGIAPSSVRAVKLLVSGKRARREVSEDGWLVVQVPPVLDHEVVAVDLAWRGTNPSAQILVPVLSPSSIPRSIGKRVHDMNVGE